MTFRGAWHRPHPVMNAAADKLGSELRIQGGPEFFYVKVTLFTDQGLKRRNVEKGRRLLCAGTSSCHLIPPLCLVQGSILSPFFKRENRARERLNNLPDASQLVSGTRKGKLN